MNYKYKVKIEDSKQLAIALESKNVDEVIIARDSFSDLALPEIVSKVKSSKKKVWIMLERISRYEEFKNQELRVSTDKIFDMPNLDGIIIQNLDSFSYMLRRANRFKNERIKIELNYTMNCYNLEAKKLFIELYNEKRDNHDELPLLFTSPLELNTYELNDVGYDTLLVYSYIDTMVTANCLRKNINDSRGELREPNDRRGELREPACKLKFNFDKVQNFSSYIIDRKGKKLHYKTYCKYCYNKIFNTEPLYLIDKIDDLLSKIIVDNENSRGVSCKPTLRIDFSFENENEVRDILNGKIPNSFTRGHIKNTIK